MNEPEFVQRLRDIASALEVILPDAFDGVGVVAFLVDSPEHRTGGIAHGSFDKNHPFTQELLGVATGVGFPLSLQRWRRLSGAVTHLLDKFVTPEKSELALTVPGLAEALLRLAHAHRAILAVMPTLSGAQTVSKDTPEPSAEEPASKGEELARRLDREAREAVESGTTTDKETDHAE